MSGRFNSTLRFAVLLALSLSVSIAISAQTSETDSVTLFQGPNGTGAGQAIPIGVYKVDGKQVAASVGTTGFSVRVPKGIKIAFCAAPVANYKTMCELFNEGTHNLSSLDFVKIEVWKDVAATKPPPVTVFEALNWLGRSQVYLPGMYRSDRNEFGKINDNMAMSVVVSKGFRARFCIEEGEWARGAGGCEVHEEGRHNLRLANDISFIEVIDLSDTSPAANTFPVILYEDADQGGKMQGFDVGTYLAGKGEFGKVFNDTASSITVKAGYVVTICADEIPGDRCEERGAGKHNLKLKDSASYIKVVKQ
ncbi:MAG TPA: hypothetical protein PKA82_16375 [Pyrinomonadaceae bacterium]|nr:hypothetical protein [Pyrinomonadaceae bacterium]